MTGPHVTIPQMVRVILHVDMDAFFAAVEQRDYPELRGKPVLVGGGRGGEGKRGVVTTASYEARVFGCKSAMPMAQARRLCPHAIVRPVRMGVYSQVSDQVMTILHDISPVVQPVSIDEAFIDLTPILHLNGRADEDPFTIALRIGRTLKDRVRAHTQLNASIGIAGNMSLAKLASDLGKPDGLYLIRPEVALDVLAPMPVGALYTVGPKAAAKLGTFGIRTIADLRGFGLDALSRNFGESGEWWWELAHGRDTRSVEAADEHDRKSIGKERTFSDDIGDAARLRAILLSQVEDVMRTARDKAMKPKRLTVKLRVSDFRTFTRSHTRDTPTDITADIWADALTLLNDFLAERKGPLRLIGVSVSQFDAPQQGELFTPPTPITEVHARKVDAAADAVVKKFGRGAIRRGGGM
jgi:DNA polymerase-4